MKVKSHVWTALDGRQVWWAPTERERVPRRSLGPPTSHAGYSLLSPCSVSWSWPEGRRRSKRNGGKWPRRNIWKAKGPRVLSLSVVVVAAMLTYFLVPFTTTEHFPNFFGRQPHIPTKEFWARKRTKVENKRTLESR
ncbi:unnamed protein product [Bursaphelenchus xylophilus]|uniref:(pine wood nematode) hypothetical protein n=1 Tax=Bursaphelenchus xylophilus TaxID=6326 RepID=A0A1I7SU12_BURXY|nr:unnamed protein product [Bursaphelenchus xylophilus]CAG9107704.1 unnamed protein product [Bursaphelenchus xylophilus]